MLTPTNKILLNLFEDRINDPEVTYEELPSKKKVIAHLKGYNSQVYTKLANKLLKIYALEAEIKELSKDLKSETKKDIADLFHAQDAVFTRVVDTNRFIFTLSKDPEETKSVKYKEILEALTNHLTPELITILEDLKKAYTSPPTKRSPTLDVVSKGKEYIDESFDSSKSLSELVDEWAAYYDSRLNALKAKIE